MKKELIIIFIFLISLSFISAFSFEDIFSKITGNVVSNSNSVQDSCVQTCLEKACGDFSSLRKSACMKADFRIKSCQNECNLVENESNSNIANRINRTRNSTPPTTTNQTICQPVTCDIYCENGFKKNTNGCDICECFVEDEFCVNDLDCPATEEERYCDLENKACVDIVKYSCENGLCVPEQSSSCNIDCDLHNAICYEGMCTVPQGEKCFDSDGGINYSQIGEIYFGENMRTMDYCKDENLLNENFCVADDLLMDSETYDCSLESKSCFDGECFLVKDDPRVQMNQFYNLEVVFYNVSTCYVAETCDEGDTCDVIRDYREPHNALFKFEICDEGETCEDDEEGGLKTVKPSEANDYEIQYCVRSSFSSEDLENVKSHVQEVSDFINEWTNGNMILVPHYRFVEAEMGSGKLAKDEYSPTGYEMGKNPPINQFKEYAEIAGADFENMDFFIGITNPFPDEPSENRGLRVQSYFAETSGEISGVPTVKISADTHATRDQIIPKTIHELIHVVNIGHYVFSELDDVYGIENSEDRGWVEGQPRPHCTLTEHYDENGNPDPYKYFPDSYNWLNPMWNSKPLQPIPKYPWFQKRFRAYHSYCSEEGEYPSINPLFSDDNYDDFQGLSENMKYYKFVFQAHYSSDYVGKLYTNAYKAGWNIYPL